MDKSPAPQAASATTSKLGVVKSKAYSVGKKLVKKRLGIDLEQPKDRGPVHSYDVKLKRLANKQGAPQMGDKMEAQQIAARQDTRHIDHYNIVVPKLSEWRLEQLYSGDAAVQLLTRLVVDKVGLHSNGQCFIFMGRTVSKFSESTMSLIHCPVRQLHRHIDMQQ